MGRIEERDRAVAFMLQMWQGKHEPGSVPARQNSQICVVTDGRKCATLAWLPLRHTSGFDPGALLDHFQKHGARLRIAADASEYEGLADALFANPRPADVLECSRPDGDVIRFNTRTDEYGVLAPDRIIRTYYVPISCRKLAVENRRPGTCHHEASNLDYFKRNCRRRYYVN
jgi:hypothetical protein